MPPLHTLAPLDYQGKESPVVNGRSDWIAFSEEGLDMDVNKTIVALKIKTAFRLDENESSKTTSLDSVPRVGDDYPMITIYCSLLGLVIITLLIYVVYKLWQQHLERIATAPLGGSDGKSPTNTAINSKDQNQTFVKSAGASGSENNCMVKHKKQKKHRDGHEHLLSGDGKEYSQANGTNGSSIDPKLILEIATGLSDGGTWKTVGSLLGYTEDQLQGFQGSESGTTEWNCMLPAHRMLTSWVSKSESAVPQLQLALEKVNAKELSLLLPLTNQIYPTQPAV